MSKKPKSSAETAAWRCGKERQRQTALLFSDSSTQIRIQPNFKLCLRRKDSHGVYSGLLPSFSKWSHSLCWTTLGDENSLPKSSGGNTAWGLMHPCPEYTATCLLSPLSCSALGPSSSSGSSSNTESQNLWFPVCIFWAEYFLFPPHITLVLCI